MGRRTTCSTRGRLRVLIYLLAVSVLGTAAYATPYFLLESEPQWQSALSGGKIGAMTPTDWTPYMAQWDSWLAEGDPYPENEFVPALGPSGDLYVYPGGGGGYPEDAGLVMVWQPTEAAPGSYSSAWKYEYGLDPDLSNCTIALTVTAPQFDAQGNQITTVSFGIQDVTGLTRAWHWKCGPGWPIQWNVPTQITINTNLLGLNAAIPAASGFMSTPGFNITQAQSLIVDENAAWVGGTMPAPPPGGQVPAGLWNYWHNITVTPNAPQKGTDPIKWSQPPVVVSQEPPDLFLGWDEQSVYHQEPNVYPVVADDWRCDTDDPVTDIHWWGSFVGWDQPDPPQLPTAFHIAIWRDVPANPPDVPFSHPAEMIWEHVCDSYQWNFAGYDDDPRDPNDPEQFSESCFQFVQYLPEDHWFYQQEYGGPGTIFWLSIAAIYDVGTQPQYPWGWKTREHYFQDDAVRIQQVVDPASGLPKWPPTMPCKWANGVPIQVPEYPDPEGVTWDVAFELTTRQADEPYNDLGDAPDSTNNTTGTQMTAYPAGGPLGVQANYPTVYLTGSPPYGPIHLNPQAIAFLGNAVTLENEADTGVDADGINNIIPPSDTPDLDLADDCITPPLAMPHCMPTSFTYTVNVVIPNQQLYVNAWCDWNRDGDWDDTPQCPGGPVPVNAPEWAVQNQPLLFTAPGTYTVTTPQFLPWHPNAQPDPMWMRITLSDQPWQSSGGVIGDGGSGPSAGYTFGETEDYYFTPTVQEVGELTVKLNHTIADHFWWQGDPDPDNEMMSILGDADAFENIFWNSITLQSSGSGNDWADITAVKVWADNDNDGKVSAGDTLLGTGTYPTDNGSVTINLIPAPLIPAGGTFPLVISYTMGPSATVGSTYHVDVIGASGTGQTSGLPVLVNLTPNPLVGATKVVSPQPITIGAAKNLLPVGFTTFLLQGKVVTADFLTSMGLVYIEETNRAAGIGVYPMMAIPSVNRNDLVTVMGTTMLLNGTELVVVPQAMTVGINLITNFPPVGMNNKYTGGGMFGGQPGVIDNAWATPPTSSYGLSNVGMLIRSWGKVMWHEWPYSIPTVPANPVFWIDDGTILKDGFLKFTGGQTQGVACYYDSTWGIGSYPNIGEYWGVTGILRCIPNAVVGGQPVRLLVPRDTADLLQY